MLRKPLYRVVGSKSYSTTDASAHSCIGGPQPSSTQPEWITGSRASLLTAKLWMYNVALGEGRKAFQNAKELVADVLQLARVRAHARAEQGLQHPELVPIVLRLRESERRLMARLTASRAE